MKKLLGSLFAVAALTLVAGGAFAKDPVGNEVLPFEFDNPPWYNHCVGEMVTRHVVGETRYHESILRKQKRLTWQVKQIRATPPT